MNGVFYSVTDNGMMVLTGEGWEEAGREGVRAGREGGKGAQVEAKEETCNDHMNRLVLIIIRQTHTHTHIYI